MYISGVPACGDVAVTTTEQQVDIEPCYQVLFNPDFDVIISINDNQHYSLYRGGTIFPMYCSGGISKFFVKSVTGNAVLCVKGMR
jgi:hypothetical protein